MLQNSKGKNSKTMPESEELIPLMGHFFGSARLKIMWPWLLSVYLELGSWTTFNLCQIIAFNVTQNGTLRNYFLYFKLTTNYCKHRTWVARCLKNRVRRLAGSWEWVSPLETDSCAVKSIKIKFWGYDLSFVLKKKYSLIFTKCSFYLFLHVPQFSC